MPILNKKKNKGDNIALSLGKVSQIPIENQDIVVSTRRTMDLLKKIAFEPNKFNAIQTIINETPDGKQAYNTYIRLANQGINVEFYNKNSNRRIKRYDYEWREFSSNIGINNSAGLDGFIDQLHGSSISRGGMACEVIVDDSGKSIKDVVLIDPETFYEYKWIPEKGRYAIYQKRNDFKKVDLYDGNFFFVPHQPLPGRPDGTLQFLPAVITLTHFYQLLADSLKILNRIGYPRYIMTIDQEALLNSVPASMKSTIEQQNKLYEATINRAERNLRRMGKDTDLITFSTNSIDTIGGGTNGSGIDVRAWFEVLEPLIVNSFNLTPVLMGRLKGGSYSLGTVEFKIVTDTVDSMRRSSKRIVESVANIWARVNGYPVYSVVKHNPIDWEVQKDKLEVQLMKMEKARRAEEYCWISHDDAAVEGIGAEKATDNKTKDYFEYLSHDYSQKQEISNGNNKNELEKEEDTEEYQPSKKKEEKKTKSNK